MNRFFLALLVVVGVIAAPKIASAQYGGPVPGAGGGPWAWHNGFTFEGNLGLGYLNFHDGNATDSEFAGAAAIGLGGFLAPNMALTLRIASNAYVQDDGLGDSITITSTFIGPSLQYWLNPQFWIGGGVGFANAQALTGNPDGTGSFSQDTGLALDLRIGVTFAQHWRRSWNLSAEVIPAFYGDSEITGVAFELGYQFL
jgi:hypothetical protein